MKNIQRSPIYSTNEQQNRTFFGSTDLVLKVAVRINFKQKVLRKFYFINNFIGKLPPDSFQETNSK